MAAKRWALSARVFGRPSWIALFCTASDGKNHCPLKPVLRRWLAGIAPRARGWLAAVVSARWLAEMKFWTALVLLGAACQLAGARAGSINRPVIGILTQPSSSSLQPYGNSYIASSYVKYAEAGGAQVVPVL